MRRFSVLSVLVLAVLALLVAPVRAADDRQQNLLFSVAVVDTDAAGEVSSRSTRILALNGRRVDLSAGWKVPIPTRTAGAESGPAVTAFSYQDIGFVAWIEGWIVAEGRVRAKGQIEVSSVEPGGGAAAVQAPAPTIASVHQKFEVVLEEGTELVLAEAPRPDGGSRRLKLAVEISP